MKRIFIMGGAGFIGSHLAKRLKDDSAHVTCVGRHYPEHDLKLADEYMIRDLTHPFEFSPMHEIDEVYQLAGEVGGLGYIQDPAHDFDIMYNSTRINLNVMQACAQAQVPRVFFASSACVYPDLYYRPSNAEYDILDPAFLKDSDGATPEWAAYPANPINAFGWEKLYAERLWTAYARSAGVQVRIGRIHNTYGPYCAWEDDRAKAVAALCRKVAELPYAGSLEVWGDGKVLRSFMHVDDAVEGIVRLMASDYPHPINIGSSQQVTIDELAETIISISGKVAAIKHVDGPVGVRGRNSENSLAVEVLQWQPNTKLREGLQKTYRWIVEQVRKSGELL